MPATSVGHAPPLYALGSAACGAPAGGASLHAALTGPPPLPPVPLEPALPPAAPLPALPPVVPASVPEEPADPPVAPAPADPPSPLDSESPPHPEA
jgi:hypothetical protein